MTIRNHFLLASMLLLGVSLQAQVTVNNALTVEELVNDVLLGEGVEATNITYNGSPGDSSYVQVGTYVMDDSETVFPIDSGLLMSTSDLNIVNEGGNGTNIPPFPNYGDDENDLDSIAGFPINNAAVIEFDFTATSDSVKFNYIFSSAEYPSWTCSNYNDVFGFFLSGPGISGEYANDAINIALIPNSTYAVGINSVNSGSPVNDPDCLEANPNYMEDSQYFISNDPPDPSSIQIPGHTVTLSALADIECGATYHIKLAIGNASDQTLQSAVFLEAGSFSAFGEVFVDVSPTIGGSAVSNPDYDSVLVAGCSEAYIELLRPSGQTVDSIIVEFGGTAVEDEDYELGENDTLFFFPDGVDTLGFTVSTLWDGMAGENEELVISIYYQDGCGEYDTASTTIPIVDPYHFTSETEDVEVICPAETVGITAQGVDGIEPYLYNWGNPGINQEVNVDVPPDSAYYTVSIIDACGFETIHDSVMVLNSIPPPLETDIDPFEQPECTNQPIALYTTTEGGNGDYTYIWEDGQGNAYPGNDGIGVENINQVIQFNPEPVNYTSDLPVYLTVIDTCGTMVEDSVEINYPFFDPITVNFPVQTDNCPENPLEIKAVTAGGAGDTQFLWGVDNDGAKVEPDNQQTTYLTPGGGINTYAVVARDKCNRAGYDYSYLDVENQGQIRPAGFDDHVDSLNVIKLDRLMNVITPNGDNKNDYFVIEGIEKFDDAQVQILDRWGKVIYETDNYQAGDPLKRSGDAFDGRDFEDGTYFYVVNVDHGECVQSGRLEILRKEN